LILFRLLPAQLDVEIANFRTFKSRTDDKCRSDSGREDYSQTPIENPNKLDAEGHLALLTNYDDSILRNSGLLI
jgi:hypothetical protein